MQTVVAAIIVHQGKMFCAKRPPNGILGDLWEFPGGKVEPGESLEDALHREIKEELGITIRIREAFLSLTHQYETHEVSVHTYLCDWVDGEFTLHVHTDSQWASVAQLETLDWVAADDTVIEHLKKKLG
jgi:8-oxo-dGTP diphosphatase